LNEYRLINRNRHHAEPVVFPSRDTSALSRDKSAERSNQHLSVYQLREGEWAPLLQHTISLWNPSNRTLEKI
jgi:hypothetical protein